MIIVCNSRSIFIGYHDPIGIANHLVLKIVQCTPLYTLRKSSSVAWTIWLIPCYTNLVLAENIALAMMLPSTSARIFDFIGATTL